MSLVVTARDPGGLRALLARHRDEILSIAARNKATNVRVFGSVARGDHAAESDIDLLVDFAERASTLDHAGLILDLRDLLGVSVDVVSTGGLRPWDEGVLQEAVPL